MVGANVITIINNIVEAPFAKPWGNYLLDNIAENKMPSAISWLPQTLGWKVLVAFLLILLLRKAYQSYKSYQKNAYRREALAWLSQCKIAHDIDMYKHLPALLRKTALTAFNRSDICTLSGKDWENWLDQRCSKTNFTAICPDILYQLSFMPASSLSFKKEEYQTLMAQISLWIKYHRSEDD